MHSDQLCYADARIRNFHDVGQVRMSVMRQCAAAELAALVLDPQTLFVL